MREPGRLCDCGCKVELTARQGRWSSPECQKRGAREARLDAIFRITPAEYDLVLEAQNGKCAICKRPPKPNKRLAVDHNHETGYIRGLLCFMCNKRVLGARSEAVLHATCEYISNPPARAVLGDRVAPGRPKKKRASRAKTTRKRRTVK